MHEVTAWKHAGSHQSLEEPPDTHPGLGSQEALLGEVLLGSFRNREWKACNRCHGSLLLPLS